jgi:hypothetical protein
MQSNFLDLLPQSTSSIFLVSLRYLSVGLVLSLLKDIFLFIIRQYITFCTVIGCEPICQVTRNCACFRKLNMEYIKYSASTFIRSILNLKFANIGFCVSLWNWRSQSTVIDITWLIPLNWLSNRFFCYVAEVLQIFTITMNWENLLCNRDCEFSFNLIKI